VRDEGIGLPPEIDETTSTGLGMRLVSAFAKQLNGSVEVKRHAPGTEFVVSVRCRALRRTIARQPHQSSAVARVGKPIDDRSSTLPVRAAESRETPQSDCASPGHHGRRR
jgi:hypothetical protein